MATQAERAWAAGLFDGEGCVGAYKSGSPVQLVIHIKQVHPAVLMQFKKVVGVGRVSGPFKRKPENPKHRDYWVYSATSRKDVREIYRVLKRWLSMVKVQQFEMAFEKYEFLHA